MITLIVRWITMVIISIVVAVVVVVVAIIIIMIRRRRRVRIITVIIIITAREVGGCVGLGGRGAARRYIYICIIHVFT